MNCIKEDNVVDQGVEAACIASYRAKLHFFTQEKARLQMEIQDLQLNCQLLKQVNTYLLDNNPQGQSSIVAALTEQNRALEMNNSCLLKENDRLSSQILLLRQISEENEMEKESILHEYEIKINQMRKAIYKKEEKLQILEQKLQKGQVNMTEEKEMVTLFGPFYYNIKLFNLIDTLKKVISSLILKNQQILKEYTKLQQLNHPLKMQSNHGEIQQKNNNSLFTEGLTIQRAIQNFPAPTLGKKETNGGRSSRSMNISNKDVESIKVNLEVQYLQKANYELKEKLKALKETNKQLSVAFNEQQKQKENLALEIVKMKQQIHSRSAKEEDLRNLQRRCPSLIKICCDGPHIAHSPSNENQQSKERKASRQENPETTKNIQLSNYHNQSLISIAMVNEEPKDEEGEYSLQKIASLLQIEDASLCCDISAIRQTCASKKEDIGNTQKNLENTILDHSLFDN